LQKPRQSKKPNSVATRHCLVDVGTGVDLNRGDLQMHKAVPCAYGGFVLHFQKGMNVTF
jgi:hypothetical protein